MQDGVLGAQGSELLDKANERSVFSLEIPIKPADFIALTVRIVIAVLSPAELIAPPESLACPVTGVGWPGNFVIAARAARWWLDHP